MEPEPDGAAFLSTILPVNPGREEVDVVPGVVVVFVVVVVEGITDADWCLFPRTSLTSLTSSSSIIGISRIASGISPFFSGRLRGGTRSSASSVP